MKELIGYWLITLAFTIFFTGLESSFSIKEKILFIAGLMTCISLIFVGVFFVAGGCVK